MMWKEISRRTLTIEEAQAYIDGKAPPDAERSFDVVVVTKFNRRTKTCVQITYEGIIK